MAAGVRARWPQAQVVEIPLADGGEGTLEVLTSALNAQRMTARVHDPLGRCIEACYARVGEMAIIEVAHAVGLMLLNPSERNPLRASSLGLGELLVAAYNEGCRHFIVGLGGTATCDGGVGMLLAPDVERLHGARFELLCDVDAPFVGPHGAARVFAPQKGATPEDVEVLEKRMIKQAHALWTQTGIDVSALPGAGAAGGLAGALMAVLGATVTSGINRVLELVHFPEALGGADLVITGEGRSDIQTLMGKLPMGVLRCVLTTQVGGAPPPVALVSGRLENRPVLEQAGFCPVMEVTPRSMPMSQALDPNVAARNIFQAILDLPITFHHE